MKERYCGPGLQPQPTHTQQPQTVLNDAAWRISIRCQKKGGYSFSIHVFKLWGDFNGSYHKYNADFKPLSAHTLQGRERTRPLLACGRGWNSNRADSLRPLRMKLQEGDRPPSARDVATLRLRSEDGERTFILKMHFSETIGHLRRYLDNHRWVVKQQHCCELQFRKGFCKYCQSNNETVLCFKHKH